MITFLRKSCVACVVLCVACSSSSSGTDAGSDGQTLSDVVVADKAEQTDVSTDSDAASAKDAAPAPVRRLVERFLGTWQLKATDRLALKPCTEESFELSLSGDELTIGARRYSCGSSRTVGPFVVTVSDEDKLSYKDDETGEISRQVLHVRISEGSCSSYFLLEISRDGQQASVEERQKCSSGTHGQYTYNYVAMSNALLASPFADFDGDSVEDLEDNCRFDANTAQKNANGNDIGDACDLYLHFTTQLSSSGQYGVALSPQPVVSLEDAQGTVVTDHGPSEMVHISVSEPDCAKAIDGLPPQLNVAPIVNGVATFVGLVIQKSPSYAGDSYALEATVSGLGAVPGCSDAIVMQQ